MAEPAAEDAYAESSPTMGGLFPIERIQQGYDTMQKDSARAYKDLKGLQAGKIKQDESIIRESEGRMEDDRSRATKAYEAMGVGPDKLQPWNAQQEWDKSQHSPLETFGSYASVFGILASLFTRAPLENALNASAAAMTAINKGDEKTYERSFTAWKGNMDLTQKRFNMQNTMYRDALSLMDHDSQAGQIKLRNAAQRFGDQQTLTMLDTGNFMPIIQAQEAREKSAMGFFKLKDTEFDMAARRNAFDQWQKQNPKADPNQVFQAYKHFQGIKEPWMENLINQYMLTGKTPEEVGEFAVKLRAAGRRRADAGGVSDDPTAAFAQAQELLTAGLRGDFTASGKPLSPLQLFTKRWLDEHPDSSLEDMDAFAKDFRAFATKIQPPSRGSSPLTRHLENWRVEHEAKTGQVPTSEEELAETRRYTDATTKRNNRTKAIDEIVDRSKGADGESTLTRADAEKQYNLTTKLPNFTQAEQRRVVSTPTLLKHLETLDWFADQTGPLYAMPAHIAAAYGGVNDPKQVYDVAKAGAKSALVDMGAGGNTLRAALNARLDRLPNDYQNSRFTKRLVQEMLQDTTKESTSFISLLEAGGKKLPPDVLAEFNKFGVYPSSMSADNPRNILKKDATALSDDQLLDMSKRQSSMTPDERNIMRREILRRKQIEQAQPPDRRGALPPGSFQVAGPVTFPEGYDSENPTARGPQRPGMKSEADEEAWHQQPMDDGMQHGTGMPGFPDPSEDTDWPATAEEFEKKYGREPATDSEVEHYYGAEPDERPAPARRADGMRAAVNRKRQSDIQSKRYEGIPIPQEGLEGMPDELLDELRKFYRNKGQ